MRIPKVKAVVAVLLSALKLCLLLELLRLFEDRSCSGNAALSRAAGRKWLSRLIGVENKDMSVFAVVCTEPPGLVSRCWLSVDVAVSVAKVAVGRQFLAVTVESPQGPNSWYWFELDTATPVERWLFSVSVKWSKGANNWYWLDRGAVFSLSWSVIDRLFSSWRHT